MFALPPEAYIQPVNAKAREKKTLPERAGFSARCCKSERVVQHFAHKAPRRKFQIVGTFYPQTPEPKSGHFRLISSTQG